jgi:hypothetical protein
VCNGKDEAERCSAVARHSQATVRAEFVTCLLRSCAGALDFPEYFLQFPNKEHAETRQDNHETRQPIRQGHTLA